MPVAIRRATLDDVASILAIEKNAPSASHWSADQYKKLITDGVVLVAEEDSEFCGFICANTLSAEWEIENLVVEQSFLRRGIASALLRELTRTARSKAAAAILLEVRESNLAARDLYEKHGFREAGRRRMYYKDPLEDAVLYGLRFEV
jgi:ribosomal-protein-alanine N-acetyltransferase